MIIKLRTSLLLNSFYLLCCSALTGCSSGGGSGSNPPNNDTSENIQVTFSEDRITGSYPGCCVPNQQVQVTIGGDPGVKTVYTEAHVDGAGFLPPTTVLGSNYGIVHLEPYPNLRAGTYSGDLVISLCADFQCTRHLGSSPYSIPYEFTVTPNDWTLYVEEEGQLVYFKGDSPMSASFQMEEGQNAQSSLLFLESAERYSGFSFPSEIYNDFDIQVIGNNITISPLPHSAGDYFFNYQIERTTLDGTNTPVGINLHLKVSPNGVDPSKLSILDKEVVVRLSASRNDALGVFGKVGYYEPVNSTSLQLLNFSISYLDGKDWIQHIRSDRSLVEPYAPYIGFQVNNQLSDAPGLYRADVTVTSTVGGKDTFRVVRDIYTGFSDQYVEFIFGGMVDERRRDLYLSVSTPGPWQWQIEKDGDWFDIAPLAGMPIDTPTISVPYETVVNMQNGQTLQGSITLKSDRAEIEDYTFPITAKKEFTEFQIIEPMEVVAGQSFILKVKGKFMPPTDTTASVEFSDGSFGVLSYNANLSTYQITHDGIAEPGTYQFHAASAMEWKATSEGRPELIFAPESAIVVTSENPESNNEKTRWRIQAIPR